jgi:hypothetical protein
MREAFAKHGLQLRRIDFDIVSRANSIERFVRLECGFEPITQFGVTAPNLKEPFYASKQAQRGFVAVIEYLPINERWRISHNAPTQEVVI